MQSIANLVLCPVKSSKAMKNVYVVCNSEGDFISYSYHDEKKQWNVNDIPENETVLMDLTVVQRAINQLAGKVLTIVDASIADQRQCKAIKDLVRNAVMQEHEHVGHIACPNVNTEKTELGEGELVDVEEIIGA